MIVKCYTDEHASQRAVVSSPYELVGWYLEQEIEGDINFGKRLLGIIEKVKNRAESEYSGTGNAHTITITADFSPAPSCASVIFRAAPIRSRGRPRL